MSQPLFSVIMPTYQRAGMIASALRTLQDQTCQDFECLIVDDGSTDNTADVLKSLNLPEKYRYFQLDHRGNMLCRNYAIENAKGEWVTYLDSDDFWVHERLALFRDAIKEKPQVGFWFSNGFLHRFDRIIGTVFTDDTQIPEGKIPGHYAVGEEFLPYITTNVAIRRSLFGPDQYGLYRKDMYILDNELYARMFAGGVEVGAIRKALAIRRIHDAQVTHKWVQEYPEALEALKAGNPSPEVLEQERRKLVDEVAGYLIKSLQPEAARRFIEEHLGEDASSSQCYKQTFVPVPVLGAAKGLRKQWLKLRYHPLFAPSDWSKAHALVQPLIDAEPQ